MKVGSLIALLSNFERAVAAVADPGTPGAFTTFYQLFYGHETESVALFIGALIKQRDLHARGTNAPPIAKLRTALMNLEACLRSAEAKQAANDVAKVVELLEECGQATIDALASDARKWILEASQPKSKSNSSRRSKKSDSPTAEARPPADYAVLLRQTVRDNAKFDQVIEELRADRKIKTPDMRDVARLFLGYELAKKKGREAALTEIVERQAVEARQEARGSVLDRLKPW